AGPRPVYRICEIGRGVVAHRAFATVDTMAGQASWATAAIADLEASGGRLHVAADDDSVRIVERLAPDRTPLWLFGAGHVGRAVARALEPLPFAMTWIDGRLGMFPGDLPAGVRALELAMPD